MSSSKKDEMLTFWSNRAKQYGADPRANTNDIWLREIEINYVAKILQQNSFQRVMDFGCANGYSTRRLAKLQTDTMFIGIDINGEMIRAANEGLQQDSSTNLQFKEVDVRHNRIKERFDFIYAIRAFQNLESLEEQRKTVDRLYSLLEVNGIFLYIESYLDGYARLNDDRVQMGLAPLPMHEHLTFLTDEFDQYVSQLMKLLKRDFPSSTYYLVTRLLYSYIAKMNDEPIDYNHAIHQIGAMIPQIGDYGPQRALVFQKT